jgi:hypothetical protein
VHGRESDAALRRVKLRVPPAASRRAGAWLHMRRSQSAIALLAIAAVLVTNVIDFKVDDLQSRILNANSSGSWSHRLGALLILAGAAVALVGAYRNASRRGAWLVLAGLMGFFFADEASSLHRSIDASSAGKLIYLPVLVLAAVCVWWLTRDVDAVPGVGAAMALLCAAYLMHLFALYDEHSAYLTGVYQAKVGLKEGTELAGLLVALSALWGLAHARPRRSPR